MALVHDMGTHGAGGGLAVGTGYAESFMLTGQRAQYLCALLYLETVCTEILQLLMVGGDGGGIDDQTRLRTAAGLGYLVSILVVVDEHAFLFQLAGQRTGGLVVACHNEATMDEVTGDGTHADATGTYEIDGLYVFNFHFLLILLLLWR